MWSWLIVLSVTECCWAGRMENFCSGRDAKRIFSGLGESGSLAAYNVINSNASRFGFVEGCQVEIITCPSCIISLTFSYLNLSCCYGSGSSAFLPNPCRSDYVWVTEPFYEDASGISFCGVHPGSGPRPKRLEYKSKTRAVRVSLFYSRFHVHAFTVDYKSEKNRQLFVGTSQNELENNLSAGFFSSPFFPATYPKDIVVEYVLVCKNHPTPSVLVGDFNCRIHLFFTDFQLAASSFVEFYEGSRRVHTVSGTSFRPPVVMSSTNLLTARFVASGQNDIGFKAFFSFISENVGKEMAIPEADCGGFVGNLGGTITMINMTDSHMKLFYCIWLIQPGRNFFGVKSHLYLKVTAFWDFAGDAELQIRRGLTSESPLLETLRYPISQNFREHVIPIKFGSYVSLRAFFGPASRFAIAYAGFGFNECFGTSDFLCENFRCIQKKLICDGSDHCGDGSDESGLCYQEGLLEPGGRKWDSRAPNYYFPKTKQVSGSVVLVISFLGLVGLLLVLTAVVYRAATKDRRQRDLQDQLRAISDLRDSFSDLVSVESVVIDDPPSYEPPPNYEDVIKMSVTRSASPCDKSEHD